MSTTTTITVIERATVARINEEHQACVASGREWATHALACGRLLADVKDQLRHGEWLPWVQEHFEGDDSTAALYMRVAANPERVPNFAGARDAKQQLAKPRRVTASDVGSFLQGLGGTAPSELPERVEQPEPWTDQERRKLQRASDMLDGTLTKLQEGVHAGLSRYAISETIKQAAVEAHKAASALDELAFSFER